MTDSRRRSPTGAKGSAWGQTHLALDAVVAFVDEELSPGARRRAMTHLARCGECAAEVVAQTQARLALRAGAVPPPTSSLLINLRAIPNLAELPVAPAGLAVAASGELVSMGPRPAVRQRSRLDRRVRLGGAAVVSGLALGALMMTATSGSSTPGPAQLTPGSMVDAQLQLGGAVRETGESMAVGAARATFVPATRKPAHQRWYR